MAWFSGSELLICGINQDALLPGMKIYYWIQPPTSNNLQTSIQLLNHIPNIDCVSDP